MRLIKERISAKEDLVFINVITAGLSDNGSKLNFLSSVKEYTQITYRHSQRSRLGNIRWR